MFGKLLPCVGHVCDQKDKLGLSPFLPGKDISLNIAGKLPEFPFP